MAKSKPTRKEIEEVINRLITHVRVIEEKLGALDSVFGLYLDWKKEKDKFNKFVEGKVKEYNKESEPGETK